LAGNCEHVGFFSSFGNSPFEFCIETMNAIKTNQ